MSSFSEHTEQFWGSNKFFIEKHDLFEYIDALKKLHMWPGAYKFERFRKLQTIPFTT